MSKALCKRDRAQRCVIQKPRASRHTHKKIISKALCKRDYDQRHVIWKVGAQMQTQKLIVSNMLSKVNGLKVHFKRYVSKMMSESEWLKSTLKKICFKVAFI